jgi:TatD DNase family protein
VTTNWPPLDLHAHVDANIDPRALLALRAVVFAATRTLDEFDTTSARTDDLTVWGAGVHPGVPEAHATFSPTRFREALDRTPLVSEVGLDRRSTVAASTQRATFEAVVDQLHETPRIASIHSTGATGDVLAVLRARPIRGAVLHWWRGTPDQTAEAVELGCRFSINAAERRRPAVIGRVPVDLLLTETDYPHGPSARQPGDTTAVERELKQRANVTGRAQLWRNLAQLVGDVFDDTSLFPTRLKPVLAAAAQT